MKKLLLILVVGAFAVVLMPARNPSPLQEVEYEVDAAYSDSIFDASTAFVRMPAQTLELLNTSNRMDMLDYYEIDSIAEVSNTMDGLSHLIRPVTATYLKVQVTPVSTLTVKILPMGKKKIAVAAYTIGDSLQAADTELRFYDESMMELDRNRFIKPLTTSDFFNFKGVDPNTRKELLDLVPFPTVEYSFDPENSMLHGRLTSGEFLGKETLEKITPYLQRDRYYSWDGKKFKLLK